MKKDLYRLLLRSLDTELGPKDRKRLDEALEADPGLREEKVRLQRIRSLLAKKEEDFEPYFETRVMGRIEGLEAGSWTGSLFTERLSFVFRRVVLVSIGILLALVISTWVREGNLRLESIAGLNELKTEEASTFLLYGINE